ncbi:hypothetical protein Hanom_Chr05g00454841 [Helianthus anomalus]
MMMKLATGGCDRCRSPASSGFVGWWVVILRQYVIHRFHRRKPPLRPPKA